MCGIAGFCLVRRSQEHPVEILERMSATLAHIERPKMGFAVPLDLWLRGPLREWAEDLLSPRSLGRHSMLAVQPIREKWQEHLSGHRNWQHLLWPVLMFQAWILQTAKPSTRPVETRIGSGARQP